MTANAMRFIERLALAALAVSMFVGLASCGSGAVGGNPVANDPNRVTILPASGTILYSGMPTTFTLSGGTGQYIVSSSNPSVLPVDNAPRTSTSITVVPNNVTADTTITLTVRDTGTAPLATADVVVKPGIVNNDIQITPSSTQGASCPDGTLCSGGDALVTATLSFAGVAQPGRLVRFDAVSGDFRFITSPSGSPETTATSVTVLTDETGRAIVRIRANVDAPNQTAILQVTDVATGAFRRVALTIAQATGSSPGFIVTPSSYTFQGPRADQCATTNVDATFFVFGGTPPYTISVGSSAFGLKQQVVAASGGGFTVYPTGQCVSNVPVIVRDAAGRTTTVTVSNIPGTAPVPALQVSPSTVTLNSCSAIASFNVFGGTGNYVASTGSGAIVVGRDNGLFQVQRAPNTPASSSPVTIGIADGQSSVTVTVNLTGAGAGPCPTPAFTATPTTISVNSCTSTAQVFLSGGSGTYSVTRIDQAYTATLNGTTLTVQRAATSAPPAFSTPLDVSDGVTTRTINVEDRTSPNPRQC